MATNESKCQSPCIPCHFGGHAKIEPDGRRADIEEEKGIDCNTLAKQNREPIVCEGAHAPIPGNTGDDVGVFRPIPPGDPPCYMPQPQDSIGKNMKPDETEMGPIGPWATGRVDWGPLAGLTGTRPVVTNYSITRYSEGEWRQRNADVLNHNYMVQDEINMIQFKGHDSIGRARADTDKNQADNTKRCYQRAATLHRWKCELERAIEASIEELSLLKEQHTRLKHAAAILMIPEAIASEALDIRSGRLEPDLVRDEVEEEIIKELALCAEIRDLFTRTLADLEHMIIEEKAAKQRIEIDWSDKKYAYDTESLAVALNNRSTIIMFQPGATRFAEYTSTPAYWEHFTRESLEQAETTRQKAVNLRGTLDAILTNASRDLRSQADKVESALARKIACTDELIAKMEIELKKILQQQVDTEDLVLKLQEQIRNFDYPMKVAQTRLDNKLKIPRVENCREGSQMGLINEVKALSESVAMLNANLSQAESCKAKLLSARSGLEREIMIKLRTQQIDRDRIGLLRSHYPSSTALTGY